MPTITSTKIEERSVEGFRQLLVDNLLHTRGDPVETATPSDVYLALCHTLRDYLIARCRRTVKRHVESNAKTVYYLSAEYLLGKQLSQNLLYTETLETAGAALESLGFHIDEMLEIDVEPGLGNGGLGRLAACFLDSLATLDMPAVGYGIRYEFGIFNQDFEHGWQVEKPDEWLLKGNPWDLAKPDEMVEIGFGGHTERYSDAMGVIRTKWTPGSHVLGEPCTTLVPGYGTATTNLLRLWRARATEEFDFECFNVGDYTRAVEAKTHSENISKVLYPNDVTPQGKRLRLQQQYFFVACSLRDIFRRFQRANGTDWDLFPEKVAIQLNDTHPVVAIPELMRIFLDELFLEWDRAWKLTVATFGYTCHTLLPEALERWSVGLFGDLLPRHLEIIYEINWRFLGEVEKAYPGDEDRRRRMSIIEEGAEQQVAMAHLATVGSHAVNGVAELQSRLLRERTLRDFVELYPGRFHNQTNGVTPRRFIRIANPSLSELITAKIGDGWLTDLERLRDLEAFLDDEQFAADWRASKLHNKQLLAGVIQDRCGVTTGAEPIFDVMVKRLHEYKRQLLKLLHIVTLYHRIKEDPSLDLQPRTFVFGAKAAPGYMMAKLIIKLIHDVGEVVNADADVAGRLTVAFPPNFNVSLAQRIYPAADISEQISMAGKEASGTGNMKFALNGAITVGTLDGANVEIRERVGAENFFLFGLTAEEAIATKEAGYHAHAFFDRDPELRRAIDSISFGQFSGGDQGRFKPIVDSLLHHDEYLLMADYRAYVDCSELAAEAFRDTARWTKMSILNAARCGFFSSDRTIASYCADLWNVKPVPVA